MSENEKNVPKRRFKEFENAEDWEQYKLGDILSLENGFAFKSKFFQEENSTTIVLTPGNVAVGGGFQNDKGRYYNVAGIFPKQFIFYPGDIFVTMTDLTPTAQTLGFPAIVPNDGFEYLHNQRLGKIVSYDYNNLFLFYLLCTDNYHNYIVSTASGTTVKHTSQERVLDYNCYIPQKDEQCKIASCFRRIDNLITLHQRKLEKMKALKKAYLTDMFPAEGERKPKLRFDGFTDDWEQRKLGDLADIVRGASPRPIQDPKWFDDKSTVGWLRISDVSEQNGRIHFLEQHISKAAQEKTRVLMQSHLLLSIAASVGKPVINYVNTGVHDGFLIFQNPTFDQEFMFQWMKMFEGQWQKYGQPGSQVNLNSYIVKSQVILIPKKEEQVKIGTFFCSIDNLITLHQRKLDKLQNIKKAYLNEMFI